MEVAPALPPPSPGTLVTAREKKNADQARFKATMDKLTAREHRPGRALA